MTDPARNIIAFLAAGCVYTAAPAAEPGNIAFSKESFRTVDQTEGGVVVTLPDSGELAVFSLEDEALRVYRRHAGGRYTTSFPIADLGPSFPPRLFAADLNTDGRDDVCYLANTDNTPSVVIFLQDQAGDFHPAPQSPLPTALGSLEMAVGDFDNDGHNDIITTDGAGLLYYRATGDGDFAFPRVLATDAPIDASGIAAGRVQDAPDQLAVFPREFSNDPGVRIFSMDLQSGTLITDHELQLTSEIHELTLADFEGDGDNDVISIGAYARVQLALNTPDGFVVQPAQSDADASSNPWGFVDDVDSDGLLDAVLSTSRGTSVFYGTVEEGQQFFTQRLLHRTRFHLFTPATDPDGNGRKELHLGIGRNVRVYEDDSARFNRTVYRHYLGEDAEIRQAFPAPWTENGNPVFLVNDTRPVRLRRVVFTPDGQGGLTAEDIADPSLPARAWIYLTADINADGIGDMLWIEQGTSTTRDTITYRIGIGDGVFAPPVIADTTVDRIRAWLVADVNTDGAEDLILAGQTAGQIAYMLGTPGAGLQPAQTLPGGTETLNAIASGDFDNDGFDDLAVILPLRAVVFSGHASDALVETGGFPIPSGSRQSGADRRAAAADFNGDGLDDIAFFGALPPGSAPLTVRVCFALPGRSFDSDFHNIGSYDDTDTIRAADTNGDLRPEILATVDGRTAILASDAAANFREIGSISGGGWLIDMNLDGLLDVVDASAEDLTVQMAVSGRACLGDLEPDGRLDWFDIVAWLDALQTGSVFGDLDRNGAVNFFDLLVLLDVYQAGCDPG